MKPKKWLDLFRFCCCCCYLKLGSWLILNLVGHRETEAIRNEELNVEHSWVRIILKNRQGWCSFSYLSLSHKNALSISILFCARGYGFAHRLQVVRERLYAGAGWERETDRQTDRHRQRERERQRERGQNVSAAIFFVRKRQETDRNSLRVFWTRPHGLLRVRACMCVTPSECMWLCVRGSILERVRVRAIEIPSGWWLNTVNRFGPGSWRGLTWVIRWTKMTDKNTNPGPQRIKRKKRDTFQETL